MIVGGGPEMYLSFSKKKKNLFFFLAVMQPMFRTCCKCQEVRDRSGPPSTDSLILEVIMARADCAFAFWGTGGKRSRCPGT